MYYYQNINHYFSLSCSEVRLVHVVDFCCGGSFCTLVRSDSLCCGLLLWSFICNISYLLVVLWLSIMVQHIDMQTLDALVTMLYWESSVFQKFRREVCIGMHEIQTCIAIECRSRHIVIECVDLDIDCDIVQIQTQSDRVCVRSRHSDRICRFRHRQ